MPTLLTTDTAVCTEEPPWLPDEAQLAAAAFLTRYNGRTLEAYRQDLRYFFQWATDQHLAVLDSTRAHIEVYRSTMEQRGLAASTIDRRLSTVCGYYRFAHIDGRISANPAQYVRRPKVPPAEQHAMDRGELGRFLFAAEHFDRAHGALAVLLGLNGLRVSEACATNIEGLGFERGHRTLRIMGKGSKPAAGNRVHRTYHRFTDVVLERAHLRDSAGHRGRGSEVAADDDGDVRYGVVDHKGRVSGELPVVAVHVWRALRDAYAVTDRVGRAVPDRQEAIHEAKS